MIDNTKIAKPIKRLFAVLIDIVIVVPSYVIIISFLDKLLQLPITHYFSFSTGFTIKVDEWARQNVIQVILYYSFIKLTTLFLYFTLFENSKWQGTIGKRLLKIKVTDYDGQRILFKKSATRLLSKFLSAQLLIGYIMILFTDRKQGLHDIIAKTLVLDK